MKNIILAYIFICITVYKAILLNVKRDEARLKPMMRDIHYVTLMIISFTPLINLVVVALLIHGKGTIDVYEIIKSWR